MMKNSEKVITYHHGAFTDFAGMERKFCICAKIVYLCKGISSVTYGYSLCTPPDEYDKGTAEKIAREKVSTSERTITFPNKMFTPDFIENVLLEKEAAYIQRHPGAIFRGYAEAEKDFNYLKRTLKDAKRAIDDFKTAKFDPAVEGQK